MRRITPLARRLFRIAVATTLVTVGAVAASPKKKVPAKSHVATHAVHGPVRKARAVSRAVTSTHTTTHHGRAVATTHLTAVSRRHGKLVASRTMTRGRRGRHVYVQTWDEPTFANSTVGDNVDGEDLNIRRAAVEALGPYNGAIVVTDPNSGRILTVVNQKLALGPGFQPCSTIKLSVALAGLKENLVQQPGFFKVFHRNTMDLTPAIAYSNNFYFATLGQKLGFERVSSYAHLFGYGEKAGLDIPGEQPGSFPAAPPKNGGVGMLTSFGEEIHQTPLELAALVGAIANGGKLMYLQYPRTEKDIQEFQPKVKRTLDIGSQIAIMKPGMQGAVEFPTGTARKAKQDQPVLGKTGTCSEGRTRLGWFGSFNDVGQNKLVVVVMLTGGRASNGPMAAGVAGDVYRHLQEQKMLSESKKFSPEALVATHFTGIP